MKRLLLGLLALVLVLPLAACRDANPPNSPAWSPMTLPSAELVAAHTAPFSLPNVAESVVQSAADAQIAARIATLRIPTDTPAGDADTLLVRYYGVLQEPLTPSEVRDGILSETVSGEAELAVSANPEQLRGVSVGAKDISIDTRDPAVFSLSAYADAEHTILFHIEVLAVYSAPADLAALVAATADQNGLFYNLTGYLTADAMTAAITAEVRGSLRFDTALAAVSVIELPADLTAAVRTDFLASFANRYHAAQTELSYSAWLALHTVYASEEALLASADAQAEANTRTLLAACAVWEAAGGRSNIPDYQTVAATLAGDANMVRFWSWGLGGSASGWVAVLRELTIPLLGVASSA